jgi:hypothetical protein
MLQRAYALAILFSGPPQPPETLPFALLVCDAQTVFNDNDETRAAIAKIAEIAPEFDAAGATTYWVFNRGFEGGSIEDRGGYAVPYRENHRNIVWGKSGYSPFWQGNFLIGGSKLRDHMTDRLIHTLFICGMNFSACEFWTARDAYNKGLKVYVIIDASADNNSNQGHREEIMSRYRKELPGIEFITAEQAVTIMKEMTAKHAAAQTARNLEHSPTL